MYTKVQCSNLLFYQLFLYVPVFKQGEVGSSWYAVLGGCLDVRLLTSNQPEKVGVKESFWIILSFGNVYRTNRNGSNRSADLDKRIQSWHFSLSETTNFDRKYLMRLFGETHPTLMKLFQLQGVYSSELCRTLVRSSYI